MPSSPSMPGTMTMSTSSAYARRSGLTISSCSGITPTPAAADGGEQEPTRHAAAAWQARRSLLRQPGESGRPGCPPASLSLHALRVLNRVLDQSSHQERLLGEPVVLALQNLAGSADRLLALDVLAGPAGELLGDEHRLAHVALQTPRPSHGDLVLLRELVHAQDGDDVLEILVALQRALHLASRVE